MEKALEGDKTLKVLTLGSFGDSTLPKDSSDVVTLPKEFCRHLMSGIGHNTSLSEVVLGFASINWDCPIDGRLVYGSHMLCDSVGCSVYIVCNQQ